MSSRWMIADEFLSDEGKPHKMSSLEKKTFINTTNYNNSEVNEVITVLVLLLVFLRLSNTQNNLQTNSFSLFFWGGGFFDY